MKTKLTKDLVSALRFDTLPLECNGRKVTKSRPNTEARPYILYDTELNGLGVRVGRQTKVYIVQVRVGSQVTKATVGRHPEIFLGAGDPLRDARVLAAELLLRLRRGEAVNAQRQAEKTDPVSTLDRAFTEFVEAYKRRPLPPKENTLRTIEAARRRLGTLIQKRLDAVSADALRMVFLRIAKTEMHQTAAEQTVRWVSAVYNFALKRERRRADEAKREPRFSRNPAETLRDEGLLRTRSQMRRDYENRGVRKPIANKPDKLGKWMEALWNRRGRYRTQVDYLLMTLMLGARKSETAMLKWADRLSAAELKESSYIDLEKKLVYIRDPKNRHDFRLPLGSQAAKWMRERHGIVTGKLVFPAVSRHPKRKVEFYSSPGQFIRGVSRLSGIQFTMHDLRRTLAHTVNLLDIPSITVARLLNHLESSVTADYAEPSVEDLRKYMPRIETELFKHASFVTKRQPKHRARRR